MNEFTEMHESIIFNDLCGKSLLIANIIITAAALFGFIFVVLINIFHDFSVDFGLRKICFLHVVR